MVAVSKKNPEGWTAAEKITLVLESAGFNDEELTTYYRERRLFP